MMRRVRGGARRLLRASLGDAGERRAHRAYHRLLRVVRRFDPPEDAATLAILGLAAARAKTILDVGANTGRYAHLFLGAAAPSSIVHAFEPHPGARELLEANVGRDRRARIHGFALGAADAEAALAIPSDELGNPVSALAHVGTATAGESSTPVRVRALDGLVEGGTVTLSPPVLAKIDVEGHEGDVLTGGTSLLHAGAWVYFESQAPHLARAGASSPWPVLRDAGYEVVTRSGDGWQRCDAPIEDRPNYLAVPAGTLPPGDISQTALVAALAAWGDAS